MASSYAHLRGETDGRSLSALTILMLESGWGEQTPLISSNAIMSAMGVADRNRYEHPLLTAKLRPVLPDVADWFEAMAADWSRRRREAMRRPRPWSPPPCWAPENGPADWPLASALAVRLSEPPSPYVVSATWTAHSLPPGACAGWAALWFYARGLDITLIAKMMMTDEAGVDTAIAAYIQAMLGHDAFLAWLVNADVLIHPYTVPPWWHGDRRMWSAKNWWDRHRPHFRRHHAQGGPPCPAPPEIRMFPPDVIWCRSPEKQTFSHPRVKSYFTSCETLLREQRH